MYNGCLKHATKLIPEKDGQGKTWQQIPQVAMATETVWYARWKISRIWSAGNCKKLTPTLSQSHDPFIITYN